MRHLLLLTILTSTISISCFSAEAGSGIKDFNVKCPAKKLSATIDNFYHECHAGHLKPTYNSCEKFIEIFKALMPTYDCARPIDISGKEKYVVSALWILGDAQFEDYSSLVHDLVFDKTYSTQDYLKARKDAAELFYSDAFKNVLDAGGEKYEDEWSAQEKTHEHRETAP